MSDKEKQPVATRLKRGVRHGFERATDGDVGSMAWGVRTAVAWGGEVIKAINSSQAARRAWKEVDDEMPQKSRRHQHPTQGEVDEVIAEPGSVPQPRYYGPRFIDGGDG